MEKLMYADGLIPDTELRHYGIPKKSGRYPWGSGENPYHHGASAPGGRKKRSQNAEIRADRKNAYKNRRTISDEELAKRINRLEKEKKFKELTYEDLYPGRMMVEDALKDIGKKVIVTGGTAVGVAGVAYLIQKYAGIAVPSQEIAKLAVDWMKPKKK